MKYLTSLYLALEISVANLSANEYSNLLGLILMICLFYKAIFRAILQRILNGKQCKNPFPKYYGDTELIEFNLKYFNTLCILITSS